jgi:hypothetical protein
MARPVIRLAEPADLPAMAELIERQLRKHVLRNMDAGYA